MNDHDLLRAPLTPADRLLFLIKAVVAVIILPFALMCAGAALFYAVIGRM